MVSRIHKLTQAGAISPPKWLPNNTIYETLMGSVAYGVSGDNSDIDIYGICMPPKTVLFPHLRGEIEGFSTPGERFAQYAEHHVPFENSEYDFQIFSIVKFFRLAMENNPNVIDSLFTPRRCVVHTTSVGELIRENRRRFLHKGAWHKFKGYAYSQLNKMGKAREGSKRKVLIDKYGYDVKFAYHTVRLLDEIEQILSTGDLNLERSKEVLKAIRRGEWTDEKVRIFFEDKEKSLESLYESSSLPYSPDEEDIKDLLLECLRAHYGDLSAAVVDSGAAHRAMLKIYEISTSFVV